MSVNNSANASAEKVFTSSESTADNFNAMNAPLAQPRLVSRQRLLSALAFVWPVCAHTAFHKQRSHPDILSLMAGGSVRLPSAPGPCSGSLLVPANKTNQNQTCVVQLLSSTFTKPVLCLPWSCAWCNHSWCAGLLRIACVPTLVQVCRQRFL